MPGTSFSRSVCEAISIKSGCHAWQLSKKERKECVMKKRIVSLLCAGLLVFSEPYPALAASSVRTEAVSESSEGAPPGAADDSSTGDVSISESETGSSPEMGSASGHGNA